LRFWADLKKPRYPPAQCLDAPAMRGLLLTATTAGLKLQHSMLLVNGSSAESALSNRGTAEKLCGQAQRSGVFG
jgi:hypothetical protein